MQRVKPHHILIPLLATLAVLPLLVHGCSCGHDLPFHFQSWLEVAQQWRHGTLYPRWAFSPAWQAGEPRFIFYPPLSWILGALLSLTVPGNWAPVAFTWIALTCAGFSMHRLSREFTGPDAALLAAAVYMANPYMLFNAFERGSFAELLAAVWVPLLFLAVLRPRPTVPGLAIPLCLVWLTNAPSGVMATYAIVLLALVRLSWMCLDHRHRNTEVNTRNHVVRLAATCTGGIVLGLALASFYLVPAAYQRRFVQVEMAIIPNLRYQDNFLFSRTAYQPHNEVTHTVSVLGLTLLLVCIAAILAAMLSVRKQQRAELRPSLRQTLIALAVLTTAIALLLFPLSSLVWEHLPEMKFLQFPWRLLTILSAILALALAFLLERFARQRTASWIAAAAVVLALSQTGAHLYRQGCEAGDLPSFSKRAFETSHGVLATDEYTPINADNDVERTDDPGYWLTTKDVNTPAPGTVQNPNEVNTNYDGAIPFENTVAERSLMHLVLTLPATETLILNLRDFPDWQVTVNGSAAVRHLQRDDGLLALALPAGASTIDIHWQRTWDQNLGLALSGCALLVLRFTVWRSRKIEAA